MKPILTFGAAALMLTLALAASPASAATTNCNTTACVTTDTSWSITWMSYCGGQSPCRQGTISAAGSDGNLVPLITAFASKTEVNGQLGGVPMGSWSYGTSVSASVVGVYIPTGTMYCISATGTFYPDLGSQVSSYDYKHC